MTPAIQGGASALPIIDIDRMRFEQYLLDADDVVFVTDDTGDCPLACFLADADDSVYVDTEHAYINDTAYKLPEWAAQFSSLDMVGTGSELAEALRRIP